MDVKFQFQIDNVAFNFEVSNVPDDGYTVGIILEHLNDLVDSVLSERSTCEEE